MGHGNINKTAVIPFSEMNLQLSNVKYHPKKKLLNICLESFLLPPHVHQSPAQRKRDTLVKLTTLYGFHPENFNNQLSKSYF